MSLYIVDRRFDSKHKSSINRSRFIKRFKGQIRKAVADAINRRGVRDLDDGDKIGIPSKDITEPQFQHGAGGVWEVVRPGNDRFNSGDQIDRPFNDGGGPGGRGKPSNEGESLDDFVFTLTRDEFLDIFFDELALPNLVKQQLARIDHFRRVRAGYTQTGVPTNINLGRTMRGAARRRIAIGGPYASQLKALEAELKRLLEDAPGDVTTIDKVRKEIAVLRAKIEAIPFVDTFDLRYNNRVRVPLPTTQAVMFCLSGETADTLAAIELAKSKGATIFGVCNVVGSSIARATDAGAYTHAGPEIGVASTKAFTAQVTVLTLLAMIMGQKRGTITDTKLRELMVELDTIPAKVEKALLLDAQIREIAEEFKDATNFLYLGRGYNFPVALEGALKLKEISYIHAEGYPAAEMKHGPIALIDENMPIVVIATRDSSYEKVVSNIQEVKARKGRIIAVVSEGDKVIPAMAEFVIEVPHTSEILTPLVSVIPLQLLSYHIAVLRGCNVDQPRNLAKSVTVE